MILLLAGILQSALAPVLSLQHVQPELVLVVVLAWSLQNDVRGATLAALTGGLLLDLLASTPFGFFSLPLLATALLANFWHDRFTDTAFLLPVALVLPYSLLFNLGGLIFLQLAGRPVVWSIAMARVLFPAALLNLPVMALVFPLLRWLKRRTGGAEWQL